MRPLRAQDGMGLLELSEAALHQVRLARADALVPYYLGSLVFVLAFLYFWADMMQGAASWRYVNSASFGVALAFIWMKSWHAVYCAKLRARLSGTDTGRWTFARAVRLVAAQAFIHATGFIVLPVALLVVVPFGIVHAFYQNANLYAAAEDNTLREVVARSWKEAKRWPGQSAKLLWLFSPIPLLLGAGLYLFMIPLMEAVTPDWRMAFFYVFSVILTLLILPMSPIGVVITANVAILLGNLPSLLRSLFGIETAVAMGGSTGNSTFLAICVGIAFMIMDPVLKAAFVLRCFHGESLYTGEDLRIALKTVATRAARTMSLLLVAAIAAAGAPTARAQEFPDAQRETAQALDQAINNVLEQKEYTWRAPKEIPDDAFRDSFFSRFLEEVARSIRRAFEAFANFVRWLDNLLSGSGGGVGGGSSGSWVSASRMFLWILLIGVLVALAVIVVRILLQRRAGVVEAARATPVAVPNIEEESVTADALPEEGWLTLARELMERGELRLAMRALFLATLAVLAHREYIRIAKHKSNREYLREVERRAHSAPELSPELQQTVRAFEQVWYGDYAVDPPRFEQFNQRQERIRMLAKQQ